MAEMSGFKSLYAMLQWVSLFVGLIRLRALAVTTIASFFAVPLYAATLTPASSPADGQAIVDNEERVIYKIQLDGAPPPSDKAVSIQLTILDGSVGVGVNSTVVSELNLYVDTADPADPLLVPPASELALNPVQANTAITLSPAPQPTIPVGGGGRWVYVTAKFYGLAGAQTITLDPNIVITLQEAGGGGTFNPANQTLGVPAVFTVSPSGGGGGGNSGGGGGGGSGIVFDLAAARADSDSTVSAYGTVTEVPFGGEWIFALVAFACGLFYLYARQPR